MSIVDTKPFVLPVVRPEHQKFFSGSFTFRAISYPVFFFSRIFIHLLSQIFNLHFHYAVSLLKISKNPGNDMFTDETLFIVVVPSAIRAAIDNDIATLWSL
jgi:hypothetical protein